MDTTTDRTLLFVKHEHLPFADEIFQYLREQTNATIPTQRITTMPREGWGKFYEHVEEGYPEIYETMISDFAGKPIAFTVPTGKNIATIVKRLAGPTKYEDNPSWTIRGKWGPYETPHTIVHASDPDQVERDIRILIKYTGLEI